MLRIENIPTVEKRRGRIMKRRSTELMIYRNLLVWVPIGAGIISLIRWY